MAEGQKTAIALQLGTPLVEAALAGLIRAFGSHQTGLSGDQKRNTIVEMTAPVIAPSTPSTTDELHKAEIAAAVQVLHDAELAAGRIAPTSELESGKPVTILARSRISVYVDPDDESSARTLIERQLRRADVPFDLTVEPERDRPSAPESEK